MTKAKPDLQKTQRWKAMVFGVLTILFFQSDILPGQDLEQTVSTLRERLTKDPVSLSGSLSANMQLNAIRGMLQRRDPFNLQLFGQLNVDILGVSAPLSVAIADGNTTYRLPSYTFVGLSPSYKWAKLHLFRGNMQFSDYTLSGHGFSGVGFELAPGKFRAMGMMGTLRKARLEDYGFRQELDPFYKRFGYALKLGYENGGDHLFATLFKAKDDAESLSLPDSLGIAPQENVVMSAEGKKKLSDFLTLQGEYAFSILTPDQHFSDRKTFGLEGLISPLMALNTSSKSSSAYNFGVDFNPVKTWALSLKYERVNPNFTSLGTLQFRNDFENISIGYRGKIRKKIALHGRIGVERNNLDDQEIEGRNRFIGAFQMNLPVTDRWQNGFSYSNFRQTTRLIDNSNPFEPVDSIYLGSVNNQFGFSSNFVISPSQRLLMNFSHQRANSIVNNQITQATSKVNNVSLNYHLNPKESTINGGISLLWNGLFQAEVRTSVITPVFQLNYRTTEKLTNTFTLSNNLTRINQVSNGKILRFVLGSQYHITKNQRLSLSIQYLNRSGAVANNFKEFNGRIGYGMGF